jgi:hypothetical protein
VNDLVPRFDLLDRNLHLLVVVEVEETTKSDCANLLESVSRVSVVGFLILLPNSILESGDTGRVVDVSFSSVTPVVFSSFGKTRWKDSFARRVTSLVKFESVEGKHLERSSGNT